MNNNLKTSFIPSGYTAIMLNPTWTKKFAKLLHFPGFRVCVQHLQAGVTAKLCYRDNTGTMQDVFMFATCPCCKIANVEVKPCLVTASDAASALNELFRLLKTYLKHNYYMRSTDWTLLYWPPELEVKQAPEA